MLQVSVIRNQLLKRTNAVELSTEFSTDVLITDITTTDKSAWSVLTCRIRAVTVWKHLTLSIVCNARRQHDNTWLVWYTRV